MPVERKLVSKSDALPFSTAVIYGDLVFISGVVGRNADTGQMAADISEQTRQTMELIQQRLEEAGSSLDLALKVTIFLTDMNLFENMNSAYRQFFSQGFPARSCVEVVSLPDREALVEIEVIAGRLTD
jgi:2-iminobutanoate/2-iminopropanoate deaminase